MTRTGRWAVIVAFPLFGAAALFFSGAVHPVYDGRVVLAFSGRPSQVDTELETLRLPHVEKMQVEKVPGRPLEVSIREEGGRPSEVSDKLETAAQGFMHISLSREKRDLAAVRDAIQSKVDDLDVRMKTLRLEQKAAKLGGSRKSSASRPQIEAKIKELTERRKFLIANYPSHTDIKTLGAQIKDLRAQLDNKSAARSNVKADDLNRPINEAKLRRDYFAKRLKRIEQENHALKSRWEIVPPVHVSRWPSQVENWPMGLCVLVALSSLGFLIKVKKTDFSKPAVAAVHSEPAVPVALQVVPSEVPDGPLTEKASALYSKWVGLARVLYTPAPVPPQGVLDQIAPLLQESSDFLPQGHEVLVKYLARSVTPGDLPSHVARTVLMTLTGAEEAGVSPEHRLAMAVAALCHDLAVVPRPEPSQDEVGSEVGRLSAAVLSRIPGLPDALLAMVEDILIGMDEFKLDTWQNVSTGKKLEPLSKVLREIDRFEKLMQKQRARLDRRAPTARFASQ